MMGKAEGALPTRHSVLLIPLRLAHVQYEALEFALVLAPCDFRLEVVDKGVW